MHSAKEAGKGLAWRTLLVAPIGLGLVVAVLCIIVATLYDVRVAARHQAEQEAQNLTLGLEHDMRRVVDTLDLSLRAAREGMKQPGLASFDPAIRQSILFDGAIAAEGFGGVYISNAAGDVVYDSLSPVPRPINVMDRAYFQFARDHPDAELIISRPLRSKADGQWTLGLARRIDDADGRFAGVVVGGLRLSYFHNLFEALKPGALGTITLLSQSGELLARQPVTQGDIDRDVSTSDVFRLLRDAPSGLYTAIASIDHVERLYSYRRIGNLPLVIVVGLATSTIYAEWWDKTLIIACSVGVLLLVGVALAFLLRSELQRRARAERAARRSEAEHAAALARLDVLFLNSTEAMFVALAHADGTLAYETVNPVWERLSGVPAEQAIGRDPAACLPPEIMPIVLAAWRRCLAEGRPTHYEYGLDGPDGRREWEVVVTPVSGEMQERRLVGVARDTTARRHHEAEMRQVHRMEAVGQLTTGIAHDFNNMCQAIMASMETLREEPDLGENSRACVRVAETAARRGATLTHRLLAFSRKQALDPVVLQPQTIILEMGVQLSRTLGGRIRVECDGATVTWPIRADGGQLDNCLYNLAINARDAMPDGGALQLSAENQGFAAAAANGLPPGEYVRFDVRDEGAGMAPQTLARALEPFFTTKAIGEGTGLGLSMVEGFARQSGGEVRIHSIVGAGTRVSLWLPREHAAPPMTEAKPPVPAAAAVHGGRVLLVDDEPTVRSALSMMLARAGLDVVVADCGEQALDILHVDEGFELLVTDQSMPGITGFDLIGKVSLLQPLLPKMLITGYDKINEMEQLDTSVLVLRKPFERAVFLNQVQALINAHRANRPSQSPVHGQARLVTQSVAV